MWLKVELLQPSNYSQKEKKRNWVDRFFGKMSPGSIRGNMFLLIVTTIGSSFFVLPHCARKIGFFAVAILIIFSALLSFLCSEILYIGFEETNSKTYNECMESLLGKKMGFFSTLVVMFHTLGSVISVWIFSWIYLRNGVLSFLGRDPNVADSSLFYQNAYFFVGLLVIFTVTLFRSIEKLKLISILGFAIIICLVLVFICLTPRYFNYYNSLGLIRFVSFRNDMYILKAWGITNYMFLNQYAITPICKTTKDVSFKRVTKIIGRTILSVTLIYLVILFCGYFSLPTNIYNEIFLLREPISGESDSFILYGKILFGSALFVGVMVRSHFVLIYFDQLIEKFKEVFLNKSQVDVFLSEDGTESGETSTINPNTSLIVWKKNAIIRNFLFLGTLAILASLGVKHLVKIVGFIGSFVGVFELIIIPAAMFLVVDRKKKYMNKLWRAVFVFSTVFLTIVSIMAVIANFIL